MKPRTIAKRIRSNVELLVGAEIVAVLSNEEAGESVEIVPVELPTLFPIAA